MLRSEKFGVFQIWRLFIRAKKGGAGLVEAEPEYVPPTPKERNYRNYGKNRQRPA